MAIFEDTLCGFGYIVFNIIERNVKLVLFIRLNHFLNLSSPRSGTESGYITKWHNELPYFFGTTPKLVVLKAS